MSKKIKCWLGFHKWKYSTKKYDLPKFATHFEAFHRKCECGKGQVLAPGSETGHSLIHTNFYWQTLKPISNDTED
jgi:hypothetical protein